MDFGDYAQALTAAQNSVPAWDEPDRRRAELQAQQVQNQQDQIQIAAAQQQQADGQAFQSALSTLPANPTSLQYRQLATKFPRFFKPISDVADSMDETHKTQTVSHLAQISAAIVANKPDLAASQIQRHIDADKAAGNQPDEDDLALLKMLQSGDAEQVKAAGVLVHGTLAGLDPKTADALKPDEGDHYASTGDNAIYDKRTGAIIREGSPKPEYRTVDVYDENGTKVGERVIALGGTKGGDPASGGGAAGTRGDVSRLINTDAGGGYVPDGVKTLGQFVSFGRGLNQRGAKSSSAGTYQINGSTMAEFAPKALGPGWQNAPFNAASQEKVGQAIFDWAKQQPDPAKALRGRWVSLDPATASRLVQGGWDQARGVIAAGETGGGAAASAGKPSGAPGVVYESVGSKSSTNGDPDTVGPAYLASLPAGRRNLLQAINEGRQAPPKPGSRFGGQLAEDLARAYPDQDATTFAAKQQTRKDFTGSGKAAVALASYNRFAAHLNSAWAIHQRLGGPNLGPLSGIAAGAVQAFSPKDVNAYNTEIDGIQGEFQKLTKLGVANEGEANRLIHSARAAQSAEGRAGALEAMASLVAGAYQPQVAQWRSAFPDKPLPVDVSPASKAVINNVIHGGKSALPMGSNGAPVGNARGFGQNATPVRVTTPAQAMALPRGTVFITPDGRRKIR